MTKADIDTLISGGGFPEKYCLPELKETHISWVLLGNKFVFKIKKPIQYSFLDFSTPAKRKYYCEREVELNRRFAAGIYLDVVPVKQAAKLIFIDSTGHEDGIILDYAVRMKKMDSRRQMDVLLRDNQVTSEDIMKLATKIASFHQHSRVIDQKDTSKLKSDFNDLESEKSFLQKCLGEKYSRLIEDAIQSASSFLSDNQNLLEHRLSSGYYRDCHGDLHTRNIFLLPDPQPFDCIEFNDDYRRIDVLNEVAFLCMDLEAAGRPDLAEVFMLHYNHLFPVIHSARERQLFVYYKSYRANVRAKVNSLRAREADTDQGRTATLATVKKYLELMQDYLQQLDPA